MKLYTMQTIIRPEVARFDIKRVAIANLAREIAVKILEENVVETTEAVDGYDVTKLTCSVVVATPEEIEAKIRQNAKFYGFDFTGSQFSSVSEVNP